MSPCGELNVCNKLQTEARRQRWFILSARGKASEMLQSDCKAFYGLDSRVLPGVIGAVKLDPPPPPPLLGQRYKQRLAVVQRRRRHATRRCSICSDTAAGSRAAEVSRGIRRPCLSTPPPPDAPQKGQRVRLIEMLPMTFVDRIGASKRL